MFLWVVLFKMLLLTLDAWCPYVYLLHIHCTITFASAHNLIVLNYTPRPTFTFKVVVHCPNPPTFDLFYVWHFTTFVRRWRSTANHWGPFILFIRKAQRSVLHMLVACNEQDMPVDLKKHAITTGNIFEQIGVIMLSNCRLKKTCGGSGLSVLFCQSSSTLTYGLGTLLHGQLPAPVVRMPEMT